MKDDKFSLYDSLALSVTLLTRIPMPMRKAGAADWSFTPAFFPLTGALTSAVSSIPLLLFANFAEAPTGRAECVAAFCAIAYVAIGVWFTRGLHLDGLCDSVDAFSAMGCDKARRLEIMKDPHPGSTAVAALVLLLILKIFAVYWMLSGMQAGVSLATGNTVAMALALACMLSRLGMSFLSYLGRYPRENGTAAMIVGRTSLPATIVAAATVALSAILLLDRFFTCGPYLWVAIIAVFAANTIYWLLASKAAIGGVTGDILGACCETLECSLLLLFGIYISAIPVAPSTF